MYELIHGNCIEVLRQMPDKSIDCIITDMPYGVGVQFGEYADTEDNLRHLIVHALPEMRRVARRVAITPGISNLMLYPQPTWLLIYHKHGTFCSWGYNRWNPILVYGSDPDQRLRFRRPDTIAMTATRTDEEIDHPSPKPLWLMRKLINRVAPSAADTILDPFMGSGTTGVAAIQLGHKFIGVELNGDYMAIAKRRIAQATPDFQLTLDLNARDITCSTSPT